MRSLRQHWCIIFVLRAYAWVWVWVCVRVRGCLGVCLVPRIFKHYHFAFKAMAGANRISFSSYPGYLESLDDFCTARPISCTVLAGVC